MNVQINQLVRSLLKKDDIGQCSLQELQQFAESNPHFGAAQLLLTKKLQTEDPTRYDEQLQKTFLYFNNPLWVEQVLNSRGSATITPPEKKIEIIPQPLHVDRVRNNEVIKDESVLRETPGENIKPEIETTNTAISIEDKVVDINSLTSDTELQNSAEPTVEVEIETQPISPVQQVTPATEPGRTEITTPQDAGVVEGNAGKEESAKQIPGLKMEAIDPFKEELVFEPFHTVDYFASQGIKFREEEKPKDKFGQQLKSFTDWLKSMKRLPVTEIANATASVPDANLSEKKVEQLAEHSLTEKEVLTETMAEVWEKQGNTAKAIEIYQKLSLLDPSKSLYFAAKISALNKQS